MPSPEPGVLYVYMNPEDGIIDPAPSFQSVNSRPTHSSLFFQITTSTISVGSRAAPSNPKTTSWSSRAMPVFSPMRPAPVAASSSSGSPPPRNAISTGCRASRKVPVLAPGANETPSGSEGSTRSCTRRGTMRRWETPQLIAPRSSRRGNSPDEEAKTVAGRRSLPYTPFFSSCPSAWHSLGWRGGGAQGSCRIHENMNGT